MITLTGGCGRGSLWGSFYLPDRETSGRGFLNLNGHLDCATPPSDWYLPPPDSGWYPVDMSPYGPRLASYDVGEIDSVNTGEAKWNHCEHSTIRGNGYYLGSDGANAPYWTVIASSPAAGYQAVTDDEVQPSLIQARVVPLRGRPCTTTTKKVYNRSGQYVNNQNAAGLPERYWFVNTDLSADFAPPDVQSTLLQFGFLHKYGHWYMSGPGGKLTTNPIRQTVWLNTTWKRPDRTTFVRVGHYEYHDDRSYTPASSIAWTKHPFVVEANLRTTTCKITHVMSNVAGRFYVRYDLTTDLEWFGYQGLSPRTGHKVVTTRGLQACILILEPGLTTEYAPDMTQANIYCLAGKTRATQLYDHKAATGARTNAVCDVQELDSNWIENLAGVKGTLDCVKPLIDGYKAVETGDLNAARKALAGGYLAYKYAIAPNISDAQNIKADGSRMFQLATANRFANERRRGKVVIDKVPVCDTLATVSYFTTYHLVLNSGVFSSLWAGLEKLGLDPSSGQIWDLIPFSFVADWFLPLGDTLRTLDAYNSMLLYRQVRSRIETFKVQWPIEKGTIHRLFGGNVCSGVEPLEYSWYDRRIYFDIGSIDPIAASDDNGLSLSQMAQGTALLTQMR